MSKIRFTSLLINEQTSNLVSSFSEFTAIILRVLGEVINIYRMATCYTADRHCTTLRRCQKQCTKPELQKAKQSS